MESNHDRADSIFQLLTTEDFRKADMKRLKILRNVENLEAR